MTVRFLVRASHIRPTTSRAWGAIAAVCALPVLPAAAQLGLGDLFSDDLDSATPDLFVGFHDERFAPNTNSASSDVDRFLGFGYANFTQGNAAPGGSGTGIVARVNAVDDLPGESPERAALNFSPDLTLDSSTQDWVMTVNAFADPSPGFTGQETLAFLAGMSSNTSRVNWQGGTDTDGLFWSLTTDGRATNDLLSFQGTPGAPATAFQVQTIDGTPADVDFAEGLYEQRWVTLAVGSHDNTPFFAIRTHEPDGFPNGWQVLESFDNTGGPTVGRAWFGVEDPFNSAGNAAVTFDNASISTLRPGDTDLDGDVDFRDAMQLLNSFSGDGVAADTGGAVAPGFDADLWLWTAGDFDQDRDVDFADALLLVGNYDGFDASVRPPGEVPSAGSATLVVDLVTGDLAIESDALLSGVAIEGENLEGSESGFDLALAATEASYVALSLDQEFIEGDNFGVSTGGVTDPSAWSFTYGIGGEAQTGQVVFVPEPASAMLALAGLGLALRRRRVA
ncbi:MAG: PEP-CTERM sorting domain-containing protein [Planctomycetota bacterium]